MANLWPSDAAEFSPANLDPTKADSAATHCFRRGIVMNIGGASSATGIPIRTIVTYEGAGLLGPIKEARGRYRAFRQSDLARLRVIAQARDLGFTLREIRALVGARSDTFESATVVTELEARVASLEEICASLRRRVASHPKATSQ